MRERLITPEDGHPRVKFRDPLHKSKVLAFSSLYVIHNKSKGQESTMKADRNVLQRLISAYQAGRTVDLHGLLQHELMTVPVSIANTNGSLRSGNKAILAEVLTKDVMCPTELVITESTSCLLIDGQGLIVALGKPSGATNFGDVGDAFLKLVCHAGRSFDRIDVIFDRYRECQSKLVLGRNVLDNHAILEQWWRRVRYHFLPTGVIFLDVPANKADLADFLSRQLIAYAPLGKTMVLAGGFHREDEVWKSNPELDICLLQASHEEAVSRLVFHCLHADAKTVVVSSNDTDVLLLMLSHFHKMQCQQLWIKSGTSKCRKYIPVHDIKQTLSFSNSKFETLIPFHAITGCDTVSYFAGHSKKSARKLFITDSDLLMDLGKGELTDNILRNAEKFVRKLYSVSEVASCDNARVKLFLKCKSPDELPPTADALLFHVQRAHYQSMVWLQATNRQPVLPSPSAIGWTVEDGQFSPKLVSLAPIPESCNGIVTCGCTKGVNHTTAHAGREN